VTTNGTNGHATATIVVVHESLAVLELIDQALRGPGHCVLTTSNPVEALDVVKRVEVDLLLLEASDRAAARELARDFRTFQPQVRVFYLIAKPISLAELAADVTQTIRGLP
jgi:DNA-binding response OmpR family regulator